MELMDESLTRLLESPEAMPLPYHQQVDISHDISLALAFLHTRQVIHRDLSSNNILLLARKRAKVTDFGMSKLVDAYPRATPLTQVPGAQVYMPPEALTVPPEYSCKLDCFSYGVLIIQMASGQFPQPDRATTFVEDPKYPTGRIIQVVPERERRRKHINTIDPKHPLLHVGLACIRDREADRPSASELCREVGSIKEGRAYLSSMESARRKGAGEGAEQLRRRLEEGRERERRLERDYNVMEKELNLAAVTNMQQEDNLIAKEQELRELRQAREQEAGQLQQKLAATKQDLAITQRDARELRQIWQDEVGELQRKLAAKDQAVEGLRYQLAAREQEVRELRTREQEVRELQRKLAMAEQEVQACRGQLAYRREQDLGALRTRLKEKQDMLQARDHTVLQLTLKVKELQERLEAEQRDGQARQQALRHQREEVKQLQRRLNEQLTLQEQAQASRAPQQGAERVSCSKIQCNLSIMVTLGTMLSGCYTEVACL